MSDEDLFYTPGSIYNPDRSKDENNKKKKETGRPRTATQNVEKKKGRRGTPRVKR